MGEASKQVHSGAGVGCAACGAVGVPGALFCARCTAPLGVVGLGELTEGDRRECLSALFGLLSEALKGEPAGRAAEHDEGLWRAYLSAFWLRPETALVLYGEALAIRKGAKGARGPWLDLGCGDGIHAGLYSGWRFGGEFDAFQSLDLKAADIYHHWDPGAFEAPVAVRGGAVAHGVDIKETAVQRAGALGVFGDVRRADATKLPLGDGSVGVIFSNMLRDLGEPLGAALEECRRVMRADGRLLISAMTPAYAGHLYFAPAARRAEAEGDREEAGRLLKLDRGRSVFCQRQLSVEGWQRLLAEHGLRVVEVLPIVGEKVIRFWDVGLRPFSIGLLRQREEWKRAGLLPAMKAGAMEMMGRVLEPLVREMLAGDVCMNLLVVGRDE